MTFRYKQLTISILLFITLFTSCKEKEEEPDDTPKNTPQPKVEIQWGYYENFAPYYYTDQETLLVDSIELFGNLCFAISDLNLNANDPFDSDSVYHEFGLSSQMDQEFYSTKSNASMYSKSVIEFGKYRDVSTECYIPIKISNTAVSGNDTLEISSVSDKLTLMYSSTFSSLEATSAVDVE